MFRVIFLVLLPVLAVAAAEPLHLGNRREIFVDDFLIAELNGAERRLHRPTAREVAIVHDEPWEGNISYYHTVFRDGDLYRMYYRGGHSGKRERYPDANKHQVVCYAESKDGINWTKPKLGLHEFRGSKENNIIWTGTGQHNFVPFKDANPNCDPAAKYKAIGHGKGGLYAFRSGDGIHWQLMHDKPVITKGAFDSQNLAFYDSVRGRYLDFHRGFNQGKRAIMYCSSADFINWTEPEWINITDGREEHLYTNQTIPYHRAPHILVAFPKRFLPGRNPAGHRLPGASDIVFMSSRDGVNFDRWSEAFLRPGIQTERWVNRNNFVAWGSLETASGISGTPDVLTLYSVEGYYQGDSCQMRRYVMRQDGFVSVNAPMKGGELLTKAITFTRPAEDAPRTKYLLNTPAIEVEDEALKFNRAAILHLPDTQNLGRQATLAVRVRGVPAGHRRLFSTYNGSTTAPDELFFDINAGGVITKNNGYSIRFNYDNELTGVKFSDVGDWSDTEEWRHLAATWDDGRVTIFFDGKPVAQGGKAGAGDLKFKLGNLRFGEDYPPTSIANEPFLGMAADILAVPRMLSAAEIQRLAAGVTDEEQKLVGPIANRPMDVGLFVNFATSAAGSVRCEILDQNGEVIPGYSLKECDELVGDAIEYPLRWNGSADLKDLIGRPLRLRFELKDADLYAIRFGR